MVNVDYFSNANASANANANAKVLLNLFLQQKIMKNHENLQTMTKHLTFLNRIAATNHHPPFSFWLGGWVLCSSSARGPLDISVCISYGESW